MNRQIEDKDEDKKKKQTKVREQKHRETDTCNQAISKERERLGHSETFNVGLGHSESDGIRR